MADPELFVRERQFLLITAVGVITTALISIDDEVGPELVDRGRGTAPESSNRFALDPGRAIEGRTLQSSVPERRIAEDIKWRRTHAPAKTKFVGGVII